MILGIGIDIAEISRFKNSWDRFGMRLAKKMLSEKEIESKEKLNAQYLASRFAAKEAAVKALGTGFSSGITPTQITIVNQDNGQPTMILTGKAEERFKEMQANKIHLSITHGKETVAAVVILEKI